MARGMHWTEAELATVLARQGRPEPDAPPPLSEAAFQAAILKLARSCGWMAFHAYTMKRSPEGFPDLVLVREAIVVAELKLAGETPTAAQTAWLRAFVRCRHSEVYLWRPEMWPAITQRLTRQAWVGE